MIAILDSGINPYHLEYRNPDASTSSLAAWGLEDPAKLDITLPQSGPVPLAQDEMVWGSVGERQLYWFPGTVVAGAISFVRDPMAPPGGSMPTWHRIYDDDGHGTGITSECCGNALGAAPGAVLVVIETGGGAELSDALQWVAERPWIDIVSISRGSLLGLNEPPAAGMIAPDLFRLFSPAEETKAIRDSGRLVFVAAGNGFLQGGPVNLLSWYAGPPWVTRVGFGEGNGEMALGPTIPAELLGDGSAQLMPVHESVDRYEIKEGGTSQATPGLAGRAANLILLARQSLGNPDPGCVCLAKGSPGVFHRGPLADGLLTADEVLRALMVTAWPPNPWTEHHVPVLDVTNVDVSLHPLEFTTYGLVNATSEDAAWSVLSGERPEPDRWRDDMLFDAYTRVRHAYWNPQVP